MVNHHVTLGRCGEGWLTLHNNTGKEITAATILVTYYDSDGRIIFPIPYSGFSRNTPPLTDEIRPYTTVEWHTRVAPGTDFLLVGTNLLSTTADPLRSEATGIHLRFADGTEENILVGNHQATEPFPVEFPEYFEWSSVPANLPDEITRKLVIDERGRVVEVSGSDRDNIPEAILRDVNSNLGRWSFYPGTRNGLAVETVLSLVLRFDPRGEVTP